VCPSRSHRRALTECQSGSILLIMLETPIRDRKAERRKATRTEILQAAWDVARAEGLAQLTLRDVATRIGMRAPSLYSYFSSKNAIYDAMFEQAWSDCLAVFDAAEPDFPRSPRAGLKKLAHTFFDYAVADLARHQLMNQRTIPGFVPSPRAYAPAVEALERSRVLAFGFGVKEPAHFDLFVALIGGLVDAQQANDPGGDRWARLLDEAVNMFADHLGLPGSRRRTA
jgi:AcrR family transcriptional regulator